MKNKDRTFISRLIALNKLQATKKVALSEGQFKILLSINVISP